MAKMTLLEMTQKILSSMDSDEIEAITDTVEAQQVVDILDQTYEELLDRRDWEYLKHRTRTLDAVAGGGKTQLQIPSDVVHVELVRYHNFDTSRPKDVLYKAPDEFLRLTQNRDSTESSMESITVDDGVSIVVQNDRVPNFWTSFDEDTIWFDAYDSSNEAALVGSNSTILAEIRPAFDATNGTFVADMPSRMFTLFFNEAKSLAWLEIKQEANPKAEQIARRHYIKLRELERRTVKDKEVQTYGR